MTDNNHNQIEGKTTPSAPEHLSDSENEEKTITDLELEQLELLEEEQKIYKKKYRFWKKSLSESITFIKKHKCILGMKARTKSQRRLKELLLLEIAYHDDRKRCIKKILDEILNCMVDI